MSRGCGRGAAMTTRGTWQRLNRNDKARLVISNGGSMGLFDVCRICEWQAIPGQNTTGGGDGVLGLEWEGGQLLLSGCRSRVLQVWLQPSHEDPGTVPSRLQLQWCNAAAGSTTDGGFGGRTRHGQRGWSEEALWRTVEVAS